MFQISIHYQLAGACRGHFAVFQQDAARAKFGDGAEIVGNENYRGAAAQNAVHSLEAAILEDHVANAQHFVHDQDVRINVRGNRKAQPRVHARRVSLYRSIDEIREARKLDDGVELAIDLGLLHSQDGAVQIDILAAGEIWMETCAYF